jgi:hypothetical protein
MRSCQVQRGQGAHFAVSREVELAGATAQLGDVDIGQDCSLVPRSGSILRGIKGTKMASAPAESNFCPEAMRWPDSDADVLAGLWRLSAWRGASALFCERCHVLDGAQSTPFVRADLIRTVQGGMLAEHHQGCTVCDSCRLCSVVISAKEPLDAL